MEEGGGGSRAPGLPRGGTAGTWDGSGTEGQATGNQQQCGKDHVTLTICTKGATGEAGKHSQHSSPGMAAGAPPPVSGTVRKQAGDKVTLKHQRSCRRLHDSATG